VSEREKQNELTISHLFSCDFDDEIRNYLKCTKDFNDGIENETEKRSLCDNVGVQMHLMTVFVLF
jgi:hypothetical protein